MKYKNLTTEILIEKCTDKDPFAWTEFVNRFSGLIEFAIKKILNRYPHDNSTEDVKDILQNLLISLWKNQRIAEIKQRHNINYWLAITARNAAINYIRTKKKEILIEDKSYFEKLPAKEADYAAIWEKRENAEKKIKSMYNFLAPREKLIFKLYFRQNIKMKDIAKMLNISIGNVTAAVTRIRQKIRSKM